MSPILHITHQTQAGTTKFLPKYISYIDHPSNTASSANSFIETRSLLSFRLEQKFLTDFATWAQVPAQDSLLCP